MWETEYTDSIFPVDHFAYTNTDKFALKYLYNDTNYKPGGAIFFYAGNEGPIESFAENTGIMFDLAPEFDAMIVFAEHRYYGNSTPYPERNASWANVAKLGYLTSIQALADYAIAWASSAPVTYFKDGGTPVGGFDNVVQNTYIASGCSKDTVLAAFNAMTDLGKTDDGRKELTKIFIIDPQSPLNNENDVASLSLYIQIGMEYMAMTDYPYPTNFLEEMPAWPVMAACKNFAGLAPSSDKTELLTALHNAANVYYNSSGNAKTTCLDSSKCGGQTLGALDSGPDGWDFQECTEIIIEMCSLGPPNDFFRMDCNETSFLDFQINLCTGIYGGSVGWNENFMNIDGVKNLYGWDFSQASNIIFTNGQYDPWSIGGVKDTTPGISDGQSRGIYNFMIEGSAHHLDLRQPMSCDPDSVVNARFQIVQIMKCWLNSSDSGCPYTSSSLPSFEIKDPTNCSPIYNGYPWGQSTVDATSTTDSSTTPVTDDGSGILGLQISLYLYNMSFYEPGGTIFFYPGNEGNVESFAQNSGIIWDLAPMFKAAIIFVEHRYWGESLPYGDDSFLNLRNIGFMTSIQAIADFSEVLSKFRQKFNFPPETKVIAIGGSYGGMLGTWMKMKYPTAIHGVWASSAPVIWFNEGEIPLGAYGSRIKKAFNIFGCNDTDALYDGFNTIKSLGKNPEGRKKLSDVFVVDQKTPLEDENSVEKLTSYIQLGIENMGMTNYPYETNFLKQLPPFPINVSCQILKQKSSEISEQKSSKDSEDVLLHLLKDIANVYYNTSGDLETACIDGETCGGGDSKFLNAGIDPWGGGGVTNSTPGISGGQSRGIYNYFYEGSAHHLDLRQPNSCDPQNVHNLRFQVVGILKCWINPDSPNCPFVQKPLPTFGFSSSSECKYIYQGYPWDQNK
ncbi:hypothetical protein FO519_007759 [Halicephalobus sp. NKZ332]|nr:hypothetical protein FO519_007759 [Halicephalobus sp. NKZ332]